MKEYKIVTYDGVSTAQTGMNEMAKAGWNVVSASDRKEFMNEYAVMVTYCREKESM